jgi:hypothetical protein
VFVHVAVELNGDSMSVVSKTSPPFAGQPGESVGLEITGTTHLFAGDGSRIASADASLR